MQISVNISKLLLAIICVLCFTYCQKISDEEITGTETESENKSKLLNIKARSQSNNAIEFPLLAYVFNEQGELKGSQNISSNEDSIQFSLGKGTYKIVTICGCGQEYSLTQNPAINDVIMFKNESYKHAKKSMMMGTSQIVVDKKDVNVEISMAYCVSSLEVFLNNIPANAKKVQLSVSPLYSYINYNGEYQKKNNGDELIVDCYLGIDGVWKAGPIYIFPGCNNKTNFIITIEKESSLNSYSYVFNGAPKASQPFIIKGTFVGEVTINGSIIAEGWENPLFAEFDFNSLSGQEGSGEQQPEEKGDDDNNPPSADSPQIGDIWNGCIVADIQSVQNGRNLLLLSLKEWDCTYPEAEDIIANYSINGITGWSLPTWEQATFLRKTYNGSKLEELNKKIEATGGNPIFDDSDTRYLCFNKDNILCSFRFAERSTITKVTNGERIYYLRAVKSYYYSK